MRHDCEKFRLDLALATAGDLEREAREELERHLTRCADCRRERDALRATLDALRSLPEEEPPRDVAAEVMRELPRPRGVVAAYRALGPAWRLAVAAVLVLGIGLGVASATKLNVEAHDGRLSIGFVPLAPALPSRDEAPWIPDLLEADARLAEAFEVRLTETETELSRDVTTALNVLYEDLQSARRDDLALIGQLIVDGHRRDFMQGNTDELFVATLAKLSRAEQAGDEGANDEDL